MEIVIGIIISLLILALIYLQIAMARNNKWFNFMIDLGNQVFNNNTSKSTAIVQKHEELIRNGIFSKEVFEKEWNEMRAKNELAWDTLQEVGKHDVILKIWIPINKKAIAPELMEKILWK